MRKVDEALLEAAEIGDYNGIVKAIQAGADMNIKNEDGETALTLASSMGLTDIVELLIDAGVNVNAKSEYLGMTALMLASEFGHLDIVELLIEAGADVNIKNKSGGTALSLASIKGYTDIVELLIDAGADVNAMNKFGKTAYDYASTNEIKKILIEAGARV